MTNEELKNMLFIIDTLLDDAITDSTRQKVKDNLTEVCQLAIKALKLQPREDCISRKAVNKIINKWLSHPDYELKDNIYDMTKKIHKLPSVIPQTVTEFADKCKECGKIQNELFEYAVSRKAVETFKEELIDKLAYTGYTEEYKNEIIDIINQMPSVFPQRKMGRWIGCKCSECNYEVMKWNKNNFCPNCGAEMRGEADDE